MLRAEADALRDQAAEKTRRRMARDRERASPAIAPLLDYVAEHLFDPELRYERMRRDCAIRDNNRSTLFRQEVGLTPAVYVRDCRFEVACRLLRDTELDAARIGELVGYRGPNVFGAAFRRWSGMTPASYRRQERRFGEPAEGRRGGDLPELSPAAWRRFVEGELEGGDADLLLRFLLDLYPTSRRRLLRELLRTVQVDLPRPEGEEDEPSTLVPSLRSLFAREDIEALMAEVVWEDVRERPWGEQRDLVRHHLRFTTRALFELLGDKSRDEGRRDRNRGVAVARLALEAATALEGSGEEDGTGAMKALAWAWVGNAKRLALDFSGADKAFLAARRRLPPEGADLETAEVLDAQAVLRRWQRRLDEALALEDQAIPLLERCGRPDFTARALLTRAIVRREMEDLTGAIEDLERAIQLVPEDRDPYLHLAGRFNLARCFVDRGNTQKARDAIRDVRRLQPEAGETSDLPMMLEWLEGLLALAESRLEDAELKLLAARQGLLDLGRPEFAAVATLDVALALLQRRKQKEARLLAEEALPMFEALAFGSESVAVMMIRDEAREISERLHEMLERSGLTSKALKTLRRAAEGLLSASMLGAEVGRSL